MQHIMDIHIHSLTLNSMPSGYLACQATAIVKAEPVLLPTPNGDWSYFIGTVDQSIYNRNESGKQVEILNAADESLINIISFLTLSSPSIPNKAIFMAWLKA